jgi:Na+-exporting ATPase
MVAKAALIRGAGIISIDAIMDPHDPSSGNVALDDQRLNLNDYMPDTAVTRFLRTIALCNNSKIVAPAESRAESPGEKKAAFDQATSGDDRDTDASTIDTISRPPTAIIQDASSGPWTAYGDPTEIAIQVLAYRFNMGREDLLSTRNIHLATEFSFDSKVKKMTVVYKDNRTGTMDVYSKGATEFMMPALGISDQEKDDILQAAENMANKGLRVLCIAHKTLQPGTDISERETVESNLDYLGLVAIYDPPRLETKGAVRECKIAGITVHMLTGDHPGTARAIAKDVDIIDERTPASTVMVAKDFDKMTDEQVDAMDTLPLVIARCSPTTKVKMVQALHRRGLYCVMTGDGVNDSPALKQANVGIAMGSGSDVAKDAAEMVLTDDNFASIVKAVEEGRRLFDNIQKVSCPYTFPYPQALPIHARTLLHLYSLSSPRRTNSKPQVPPAPPHLQHRASHPPPHRPRLQRPRQTLHFPPLAHRNPLGKSHHLLLPRHRPRPRREPERQHVPAASRQQKGRLHCRAHNR